MDVKVYECDRIGLKCWTWLKLTVIVEIDSNTLIEIEWN